MLSPSDSLISRLTASVSCSCIAIKFMFERMDKKWILRHQFMFLKALIFIMMDLTSEVCVGRALSLRHYLIQYLS